MARKTKLQLAQEQVEAIITLTEDLNKVLPVIQEEPKEEIPEEPALTKEEAFHLNEASMETKMEYGRDLSDFEKEIILAHFSPPKQVAKATPKPKRNIGGQIRELILKGAYTNLAIVELILLRNEGTKTTVACVSWYKNKMRNEGIVFVNILAGAKKQEAKVETKAEYIESSTAYNTALWNNL